MTIEDTIRTEMMRLQQLLGRLEEFKREHESTERCKVPTTNCNWEEPRTIVSGPLWAEAFGKTVCRTCGLVQQLRYTLDSQTISDPWSDLREDEEE